MVFKKVFKILPIILLISIPSLIALYNDTRKDLNCNLSAYENHPKCAVAKVTGEDPNSLNFSQGRGGQSSMPKINAKPEINLEEQYAQLRTLKTQIYEEKKQLTAEEIKSSKNTSFLQKTETYNQAILELLTQLPKETKVEICKNNSSFIPNTESEAKIKEVCDGMNIAIGNGKVQGVNSEDAFQLFEITEEDLDLE